MGQALTSMGLCSDCLCCCGVEAYEDVDSYQKTGPNDKTPRWNPNEEDAVSHGKSGGSLMPCPFTGPKMFWAGPNFLCQAKNLFTYCGSHKHFVPDQSDEKMICIQ